MHVDALAAEKIIQVIKPPHKYAEKRSTLELFVCCMSLPISLNRDYDLCDHCQVRLVSCPVGGGAVAPGTRMCAVGDPRLPLQRRDVFLEVDGVAIDQIYSFMKDPRGYDVFRVNGKLVFFPN